MENIVNQSRGEECEKHYHLLPFWRVTHNITVIAIGCFSAISQVSSSILSKTPSTLISQSVWFVAQLPTLGRNKDVLFMGNYKQNIKACQKRMGIN